MQGCDKKITGIVIEGHGNPNALVLYDKFYQQDIEAFYIARNSISGELQSALSTNLASDAAIVLISCSTGKPLKNEKNLAETIADLLPGRTVIAPKHRVHDCQIAGKIDEVYYQHSFFSDSNEKIKEVGRIIGYFAGSVLTTTRLCAFSFFRPSVTKVISETQNENAYQLK